MTIRRGAVRIGWFSSVSSAIVGAFFGVVVFFASVGLLWWIEGRVNLANLARSAQVAAPDRVDSSLEHRLVSVTSAPTTDRPATDATFLEPLDAISLSRRAEMYAWIERTDNSRRTYAREWTASPPDSRRFRDPRGHENPAMVHGSHRFVAASGRIGVYAFVPAEAALPGGEVLAPTREMLRPGAPDGAHVDGDYVYIGRGALARPDVGDTRLAYRVYRPGTLATLFGEQHAGAI
ncbi:MAG: TMEM43 family protein, partial [Deltaproteobacteria bacterium]